MLNSENFAAFQAVFPCDNYIYCPFSEIILCETYFLCKGTPVGLIKFFICISFDNIIDLIAFI